VIKKTLRQVTKKLFTGSSSLILKNSYPDFSNITQENLGLYLHIPFCKKPCLYCPYFKEPYQKNRAISYSKAVLKEIDFYRSIVQDKNITSFYIGGGTPTTMIDSGLDDIITSINESFNCSCTISSETHPNDINQSMIKRLHDLNIEQMSMGIESFNDKHLRFINRPYQSMKAKEATKILMNGSFNCVNIDLMFGYPNQSINDVKEDVQTAINLGVDQISTYPIFTFPHTKLDHRVKEYHSRLPSILLRRHMFKEIEHLCYDAGLKRTSVWAFTKENKPKYSSVTIPYYIGLGAGAGSLIPQSFYLNAFNIDHYINILNKKKKPPVVLTIDFSEKDEMIHWLYWRIYETIIQKQEFKDLYQKEFDQEFGHLFSIFEIAGFCKDTGNTIIMTDRGNYWIHVLQNLFSLDFIGRVWNECLSTTNPADIELI